MLQLLHSSSCFLLILTCSSLATHGMFLNPPPWCAIIVVEQPFSYANSVIQALYFCSPFRDLTLQEVDRSNPQEHVAHSSFAMSKSTNPQLPVTPTRRRPERKLSISGIHAMNTESTSGTTHAIPSTPPSLFSALRSLFAYIAYHPLQKGTIAPRAFIEKLKEINELFRSSMHQDAHEFLMFLLNRVVEEIEEERKHLRHSEDCELNACLYCIGSYCISIKFNCYPVPSSHNCDNADD